MNAPRARMTLVKMRASPGVLQQAPGQLDLAAGDLLNGPCVRSDQANPHTAHQRAAGGCSDTATVLNGR